MEKKKISVYVEEDLYYLIKQLSDNDKRSMSSYCSMLIEEKLVQKGDSSEYNAKSSV
jgi:hypothetical protein